MVTVEVSRRRHDRLEDYMRRQDFVLAVLAAGDDAVHDPVQIQKLCFLLDRMVPRQVEGPWFHFEPDAYGPFDKAVYEELRALQEEGLVAIRKDNGSLSTYQLTPQGRDEGQARLAQFPEATADYIRRLSAWVRRQSFSGLVSAVYRAFPEMTAKSVFQEAQ
jgi:hypothetical protein